METQSHARIAEPFRFWERAPVALPVLGALGIVYYLPHLLAGSRASTALDWQYFQYLFEAARESIVRYGQFPAWTPWSCGGYVLHANPQTPLLSPFFFLILPFGTVVGMKLYVLAHILVGLGGGYVLGRVLGLRGPALYLLPLGFCLGARFAWILQGGQFTMLGFYYLPWAFTAFLGAQRRGRFVLLGAASFGLMFLEGATYAVPLTLYFLSLYVLGLLLHNPRNGRAVVTLVAMVGLGALLAAPKLVPTAVAWLDLPRHVASEDDHILLGTLLRMLLERRTSPIFVDRHSAADLADLRYRWWGEYGAYLGPVLLGLALVAFARRYHDYKRWLWLLVVLGATAIGMHGWFMPYELLRRLPVYADLRVPTRHMMLVVFVFVIVASLFLDELTLRLRSAALPSRWSRARRLLRVLPWTACAFVAVDMSIFVAQVLGAIPQVAPRSVERTAEFRRGTNPCQPFEACVRMNVGTLGCYDPLFEVNGHPRAIDQRLYAMTREVALAQHAAGSVRVTRWSPNRIDLAVDLSAPTRVLVRSNFDNQWIASAGRVVEDGGLLALDLPAGRSSVRLEYSLRLVVVGAIVSAATLLVLIVSSLLRRRSQPGCPGSTLARPSGRRGHSRPCLRVPFARKTLCQASSLLPQLSKLAAYLARREAVCARYEAAFDAIAGLSRPRVAPHTVSARHLFTLWVPTDQRDGFLCQLGERGVGCAVNYRAVHTLRYYRERLDLAPESLPHALGIGNRTVTLPLYASLTDDAVDYVIDAVRAVAATW
ncbi:MAG: DegT/DnrJ/EryC1/StrS family aminotransferase [Polyangiaceae bacterium]|nr:DegT/DnrJ/EryC1/StrS family aminotransferase [Polyangiaceae bacterium]